MAAAEWAGIPLAERQLLTLERYADFLIGEAVPAGGMGPDEAVRMWPRHLADSLVMGKPWGRAGPEELLDIGSGVGLPGIPLAIAWPGCAVTLLDRGRRRVRLLERATTLLGLPNVEVAGGDVFDVVNRWEALAFRGSITPKEAVGLSSRLLSSRGVAVLALSRLRQRPRRVTELIDLADASALAAELLRVPEEALDHGAWLLIIRRRGGND